MNPAHTELNKLPVDKHEYASYMYVIQASAVSCLSTEPRKISTNEIHNMTENTIYLLIKMTEFSVLV